MRRIEFPRLDGSSSCLTVFDKTSFRGFHLRRVFTVESYAAVERGGHAHRECTQILYCLKGVVSVMIEDADSEEEIVLSAGDEGIVLPPLTWSVQKYQKESLLLVLCDKDYAEDEYIRDRNEFDYLKGRGRT